MSEQRCPTCSQALSRNDAALVQARIATRPFAGPAQARYITRLEAALVETYGWVRAKCTIGGCWKSAYVECARRKG